MKTFQYRKSFKIIYWGCAFDSMLELKYAISIREDFQFLRAHIPIYYDPLTRKPTNYIRQNIRRYTPDFLIRHKKTKQAFLVEVKPRGFNDEAKLELRAEVAQNYIRWKGYDWLYKVVYDDEIILSAGQRQLFDQCGSLKAKSYRKICFEQVNKQFDRSAPSFFSTVPCNSCIEFVMFGSNRFG